MATMTDAWDEATFAGSATARARRSALLTPQQRLEWLERMLREAEQLGILAKVRQRRQHAVLKAWEAKI